MKFNILTLESFDCFMELLNNFDKDYWRSSDKKVYTSGKKKMDKIESITKNNSDFKELFELWDSKNKVHLDVIRSNLKIYSGVR